MSALALAATTFAAIAPTVTAAVAGAVTVFEIGDSGQATLVALCGGAAGFGLFLVLRGLSRRAPDPVVARPVRQVDPARQRRLIVRVGAAVVAAIGTALFTGWVVGALLAGLGCWFLPRVLGRDREHARRVARIEAVATWTEMIRDTLSAAAGLEQAILATAGLAPAPVREEVAALAARLDRGERLVPALRMLARDLADLTADLVVAALVIASQQQARQLADLLGALAATARERAAMRMRVEAGRARSRTSVRVIVGTTCAFAVFVVVLNRSYLTAYDSMTGQIVLLGVGLLFAAGFAWLGRIAAVSEPERLLSKDEDGIADATTDGAVGGLPGPGRDQAAGGGLP